ncbi:MAG: GNAT family N-acetyltransferase [Candidatus Micrarchaeia archaeon]
MVHVVIRRAARADIPAVARLCVNLAVLEGKMLGREPNRYEVRARTQREILFDDTCAYFVAEADGKIAGVIKVADKGNGLGKISESYVLTRFRRKGIMTLLFAAALKWARARRVRRLYLTVVASNGKAVHFWKNLGFIPERATESGMLRMSRPISMVIAG